MKKYFLVDALCGHVGKNWCIEKTFAIAAETKKDAAYITRRLPRVRHDDPKAILRVIEVGYESYENQRAKNNMDPYFLCTNIQEQNLLCPDICDKRVKLDKKTRKSKHSPISHKTYILRYAG